MNFLKAAECAQSVSLIFIILRNKRATFFATLLQKELNSKHIPPSIMKKNLAILLLACVASVERGRERGRGNLGVREALFPSRVPKFPLPLPLSLPLPLPFSTPVTQATLLQDRFERGW